MRKIIALALAALIALSVSACNIDPIVTNKKSVYMVGDSILMSASWNNDAFNKPAPKGYAVKVDAFMGKKVADYQDAVASYGKQDAPERLVIELGTNDAHDGWSAADTANYQKLVDSAPARTCIVAVVPAAAPTASAADRAGIADAQVAIRKIMAKETRKQVAESSELMSAHPEQISGADGIHLLTQTGGADWDNWVKQTYSAWIWSYANACKGA